MKAEQILVFCKPDFSFTLAALSESSFELKEDMQLSKDNIDLPVILILPSSAGLPFKIELPFGDKNKVEKVIPQFVVDLYADVTDNWLFSWDIICSENTTENKWIAYGQAFPPEFSPDKLLPNIPCNLAIPDTFIATKLVSQNADNNFAINIISPGNNVLAIFSNNSILRRILGKNSGIPIKPILIGENIEQVIDCDLIASPIKLKAILKEYLVSKSNFDISLWRQKKSNSLQYTIKIGLIIFAILTIVSYHIFIWFEAVLYERAANRTTNATTKAFSQIFPGMPVVEPITQTKRATGLIKNRLSESAKIPTITWQHFLNSVYKSTDGQLIIHHISARPTGWRIIATAPNYQSIDTFKKQFINQKLVKEANVKDARSIATGIHFKLEGKWAQ